MADEEKTEEGAQDPFKDIPQVGTEEPRFNPKKGMMNLKGKDYLQVAHRIVWFRDGHPIESGWAITTEIVEGGFEAEKATVKATVTMPDGRTVATGYKTEEKGTGRGQEGGFPEWVEKAETGAIGRALGLCGFGTIAAGEFDEGDGSVCDSPQARRPPRGEGGEPSSGGVLACSKCKTPITQGRANLCKAKKMPNLCKNCE